MNRPNGLSVWNVCEVLPFRRCQRGRIEESCDYLRRSAYLGPNKVLLNRDRLGRLIDSANKCPFCLGDAEKSH